MMVMPVVNRIADEWENGRVLRLNVSFEFIQVYASQVGVEQTPTFILFDAQGEEMQRWVGSAPDWDELPGNS